MYISFVELFTSMACVHQFIQIENRSYSKEIQNVVHQCSKCGLIDKTIPNQIHVHSDNNMSFIGQSMGFYILRCKESNCNHQIRIQFTK